MNKPNDLSLRDIRYCLAVMQIENMNRTAELLGVSQTTLTYAVKRVEVSLGVLLFVRSSNGLKCTPEAAMPFA